MLSIAARNCYFPRLHCGNSSISNILQVLSSLLRVKVVLCVPCVCRSDRAAAALVAGGAVVQETPSSWQQQWVEPDDKGYVAAAGEEHYTSHITHYAACRVVPTEVHATSPWYSCNPPLLNSKGHHSRCVWFTVQWFEACLAVALPARVCWGRVSYMLLLEAMLVLTATAEHMVSPGMPV